MAATTMSANRAAGFTFIELLIAVAIVAILAAVAYPQYNEYSKKARRSQISGLLVQEAQKLERYHSRAGQYADHPGPPAMSHEVSAGNEFYTVRVERAEHRFELTATPNGGTMMSADACGSFVLDHTGKRDNQGASGGASVGRCWGR